MTKKAQFWAYYDVDLTAVIQDVWRELDEQLPTYYQKETQTHLTIHPRFQFPNTEKERFRHYVHESFPRQISLSVTEFYYYPNKHQPRVICFDVETDINFTKRQQELVNRISRNEGRNIAETAPPHITLYRSNDTRAGKKRIPSNVPQVRTKCKQLGMENLPIIVRDATLEIDKAN